MRHLGAPQRVVLNQYNIKPQCFPSTNFRNLRFKPNPSSSKRNGKKSRTLENRRAAPSHSNAEHRQNLTLSPLLAPGKTLYAAPQATDCSPGLKIVRQEHTPHHKHDAQNTSETMDKPERNGTVRIHPEGETLIINRLTAHNLPDI
mgnify:CR=1 FL=1